MPHLETKIVLLCAGLALSCTTQEGRLVAFEPGAGGLTVNATMREARIFLDYRDSGKKTPAQFAEVPAGRHVVHVFLPGYRVAPDSIIVAIEAGAQSTIDFDLQQSSVVGEMEVQTEPAGALVWWNGLPLGRSPLVIDGILSGTHALKITKGGYFASTQTVQISTNRRTTIQQNLTLAPPQILVEHFSNTDCPPCPEADEIIENTLAQQDNAVAALSYHPDFPGRQDPFFLAAEEDNLARYGYYNRPPLPFVVVDGVKRMAGTINLEQRLTNALSERKSRVARATLDFWELFETHPEPNTLAGRVRVEAHEDLSEGNAMLHVALIEREIDLAVAPGSNGQKHFFDVVRGLSSNPEGRPVRLAKDESAFYDFRFALKPEWSGELHVVAFLQSNANAEVLQALWSVR